MVVMIQVEGLSLDTNVSEVHLNPEDGGGMHLYPTITLNGIATQKTSTCIMHLSARTAEMQNRYFRKTKYIHLTSTQWSSGDCKPLRGILG
jgi:hypothetical protein